MISYTSKIPTDTTHYIVWHTGIYLFRKNGKQWLYWSEVMNDWQAAPDFYKFGWWFGYRVEVYGKTHKLQPAYGVLV